MCIRDSEHTAALDPKTAKKVLDLTEKIVERDNLTTIMLSLIHICKNTSGHRTHNI